MRGRYLYFSLLLIVAAFLLPMAVYSRLPETMPTHWNIHGQVDGVTPRFWGAFLLPMVMGGVFLVLSVLDRFSPQQFKLERFRGTWEFVTFLVMGLMLYDHALLIGVGLGLPIDLPRAALGALFLFLVLCGNVLGKVRRNFWIGVRTPWTLASERVWQDTHRMAARVFVIAGLLGLVALMAHVPMVVVIVLMAAAIFSPVVYSLVDYRRLARQGEV